MRRVSSLLLLLLVASAAYGQSPISSTAGRWSIQLPAGMTALPEQQAPITTQLGDVIMNIAMAQDSTGSRMMMVAWCDYPQKVFENGSQEELDVMFDSARVGGLRNVKDSKLISEERIELDGLPGRSIRFTGIAQGKPIYARFDYYIDVPRLYQIGYIAMDEGSVGSANVRRTFASFAVTPKAEGGR